jgi:hypothetical protein
MVVGYENRESTQMHDSIHIKIIILAFHTPRLARIRLIVRLGTTVVRNVPFIILESFKICIFIGLQKICLKNAFVRNCYGIKVRQQKLAFSRNPAEYVFAL